MDALIGNVFAAEPDVTCDRAGEEKNVLQNDSEILTQ